jgi:hypothetical protein
LTKSALHERCSECAVRITLSLAFLAPAIVRAAVEGRLPNAALAIKNATTTMPLVKWAD